MKPGVLIGLSGRAGSGKSSASRFISEEFGIPRRPFAYPVKAMVGALGIHPEVLDGPAAVKALPTERLGGHSVRYALQTLGTEWGRVLMGQDFWVNIWLQGLVPLGCVADDVRFPNEAAAIRSRGGFVIRIVRDGAGIEGAGGQHASEAIDIVPYDAQVSNNGTIEELHDRLLRVISILTGVDYRAKETKRAG